nr:PEPxxWA-CTERM sorting domain-containing protein [Niveibacterium umoris]
MNDQGQILTTRYPPAGQSLVLLTAAVPEPSGWTLMLCGIGMIGAIARRRSALR